VQPPMVMLKLRVLAQAQDAPGRGHGACARREDGTQKQDWRVVEHRLREEGRACYYQSDKLAGHGSASTDLFLAAIVSSFPALRFVFKDQKWIKSSSDTVRNLFTVFVEDHLKKEGVTITEVLESTCTSCNYRFEQSLLRDRLADGALDI